MSDSDEELQKSITSLLIEGASIITIDNITGRLQSRHLDAVLTSDMWRGRILGVSKMTLVPQRATWLATGNNIKLGGDLARRCYRIRLDAKVSRPFMRKNFTHSDLVTWVSEHRAELVGALLTLARAWLRAFGSEEMMRGEKTTQPPQVHMKERWTNYERSGTPAGSANA
jgi:hypothetical protein